MQNRIGTFCLDLFFLCRIKESDNLSAADDVDALQWIPIEEIEPEKFGLQSIRKGVELFKKITMKNIKP